MAAVVLGGCGPDESELRRDALDDAVAATLDGTLAFNLTVDADEEALAGFGDAAEPLQALLAGSSAAGVIEQDRIAVGLALAGADLAQVRVTGPDEQYLRFNLGGLAEVTTGSSLEVTGRLEAALADAGLEPAARDAVLAAGRGEWVRLDTSGEEVADDRSSATSVRDALAALLTAADPVGHTGALDEEPFDGRLDVELDVEAALAAAAQALAGITPGAPSAVPTSVAAERLPGRIEVEDGLIRSVAVRLGPLAGDARGGTPAGAAGEVELVLDLRRLDVEETLVQPPDVDATVTLDQLEAAATAVQELQGRTAP